MTVLAWAFVATRVAHTAIHTTTNNVLHRCARSSSDWPSLILMWLVIVIRLLGA